jgi:AraC family transcriptional regulator
VLVHIQQHLDEPLRLDELAAIACFSSFHFHRIFRGMVGESVKEYIRRLRLERAASQLRVGKEPVTQIALDAGYSRWTTPSLCFESAAKAERQSASVWNRCRKGSVYRCCTWDRTKKSTKR